jgi:hypothetical protein
VCTHAERDSIDRAIITNAPTAELARRFAISSDSLRRHRDNHIPTATQAVAMAERIEAEGAHAESLADSAVALRVKALELLARAETAGDLRTALIGVREASRCLQLQAQIVGEIDTGVTVNIAAAPVVLNLGSAVLMALLPYPEARSAVAHALATLDGGPAPLLIEGRAE